MILFFKLRFVRREKIYDERKSRGSVFNFGG